LENQGLVLKLKIKLLKIKLRDNLGSFVGTQILLSLGPRDYFLGDWGYIPGDDLEFFLLI
jgi:hypothetical protein